MMTILDSGWSPNSPSPGDILVCVGYKNHWDIVNGRSGYAQHLHTVESTKAHLVAALDLYEDQEVQLLLCYNRKLRAKPPNPSLLSLSCRHLPLPENKRREFVLDRFRFPLELSAYGYW
jgi:hypothetical protein